jgi:dinuclear metal center YbgI/SA1388 family protein
MQIKQIISYLESIAPRSYQESYDNAGLITGNPKWEITGVLICLDSLEEVVDEAITLGANLIVAHHPIVFKGLKKINGKNYVERIIIKAIKNDIALYAIHTNLDNVFGGVNSMIGEKLGLINTKILAPKGKMQAVQTTIPSTYINSIKEKLTDPNILIEVKGDKVQIQFPDSQQNSVVKVLNEFSINSPIFTIEDINQNMGSGLIGELAKEMDTESFFKHLKKTMDVSVIRHTKLVREKIKKVALCGGSGSFLLQSAKSHGADIYISADFKYHEFFDADGAIIIADIGHFESEQYTINLLYETINQKFSNFAIHCTKINTNPIKYYI